MTTSHIAVISDIHIGPLARSQDLLPPGVNGISARDEKFILQFEKFVQAKKITADYLVIAGDLSCKAQPDEFIHASTVMSRVANILNVTDDKVMYVPGNHDVDWAVLNLAGSTAGGATQDLRWRQRYDPITATENLFIKRTRSGSASSFTGQLFDLPYAGYWRHGGALFAAVNSAAHDRPAEENHHGFIRHETIEWLRENVPPRSEEEEIRCLILHHHLIPHGNLGDEARDFSTCQNGDRLLEVVRQLEFDIVLHGHKHYPRFQTELVASDHPILVLGAGSFCASLNGYGGGVQNQFHLLTIEGRSGETGRIFGELRNWAYVHPLGWTENKKVYTVVDHLIGFGGPLNWRELVAVLQQPIRAMSASGQIFCLDQVPESKQLRYVSTETARKAIEDIARSENLDVTWVDEPHFSAYFRRGSIV
ncbi:metallophosphoesterase family protein [Aromatoleum diolicum]|uniref:Calcineurin-like phosphoesterase domain-containing protein n=1 Tax=Aromatoleum diolicum TaxID=75796 RepID=A0ABX1QC29_9RHOO|nr:metallophosphoesterase [Aromatoleum diolicum]NMG75953.1 hypothetical protein [Aromatoleum diolicum]